MIESSTLWSSNLTQFDPVAESEKLTFLNFSRFKQEIFIRYRLCEGSALENPKLEKVHDFTAPDHDPPAYSLGFGLELTRSGPCTI